MSADKHFVTSNSGVLVPPNASLKPPAEFDYIVVVGGRINEKVEALDSAAVSYVVNAARAGVPVIGLCTG
ncbi:DJ-1/PfpI family protein, partial [Paraburkholderia sp. SIMBA_030]